MNNSATPFGDSCANPGDDNAPASRETTKTSKNSPTEQARSAQDKTSEEGRETEIIPYKSPTYMKEKTQGLRRANGARKLKKLSARHLEIISHHLHGRSGEEIGILMNCTIITVSRVLNDPLSTDLLSVIYKDRQGEIDALAGAAIDAVRKALLNDGVTTRERLSAVDRFTKLKDTIGKDETAAKTAEDVVTEIFNKMSIGDNALVQVNIGKGNG